MSTGVVSASVALLGCGNVGGALVRLLDAGHGTDADLRLVGALVREPARSRSHMRGVSFTSDAAALFACRPDVVVELLGGVEPARTLVLEALARRTPVVTANKTLLARHGAELREAAHATNTPLLYEAAVIAGVPFLGTFARRPRAARATSLLGIANGTSNFVLTRCAQDGMDTADALAEAQRLGYAEPDPHADVSGIDAVEKLAVLLQHFAAIAVDPDAIERTSIAIVDAALVSQARDLGGIVKPVIHADWTGAPVAFAGPAFVPSTHPLATVDGVENAVVLGTANGRLLFQGPGAGPDVTASTVLDDVSEVLREGFVRAATPLVTMARAEAPDTPWLVALDGPRLPRGTDVADYLAGYGIFVQRGTARETRNGRQRQAYLTWPAPSEAIRLAFARLCEATGCRSSQLRAVEEAE